MEIQKIILICIVFLISHSSLAEEVSHEGSPQKPKKVVYPERSKLEFEGDQIEGELRHSGEFYFQHKSEESHESLVKRKANFHKEMLRDAVLSK